MTEWEAIGPVHEEFKAWWAEFGKRFETASPFYQSITESAAYYGFLAARGLDFDRALADDLERTKARLAELRAEA